MIEYGFEIFHDFSDDLKPHWDNLYKKGGHYNLSFNWCQIWYKNFPKNKKPYIITFWQDKELLMLAPFYLKNNRLSLIGTKPDMYDEFGILCNDVKIMDKLTNYILQQGFEMNFKHINAESILAKKIINKIAAYGIAKNSGVSETELVLTESFSTERIVKSDIRRCKKHLFDDLKAEYIFEFAAEKNEKIIDELIKFHKFRWNGGMLEKKAGLENFVREITLNNDDLIISRLSISTTNETAAYCIGYINKKDESSTTYNASIATYNANFKKYAPGKILYFELITSAFQKGITKFGFGRGSEPYKRNFASDEQILFNLETYNNSKIFTKVKKLNDKLLRLIFNKR
ncbi:MAG: GNAT family N-acetyltransferase [Candidatus Gastranaerophilaceae bacterium]|jgi:hypothetical protein